MLSTSQTSRWEFLFHVLLTGVGYFITRPSPFQLVPSGNKSKLSNSIYSWNVICALYSGRAPWNQQGLPLKKYRFISLEQIINLQTKNFQNVVPVNKNSVSLRIETYKKSTDHKTFEMNDDVLAKVCTVIGNIQPNMLLLHFHTDFWRNE